MYKAYCDEAKAVFLCLTQKKKSQIRLNLRLLAEMVGFEPTCPIKDKTISSRSRYDRFDTSPSIFSWVNLRFVYRKSALKLGTVAVRILLENASFRQALKPVRTSKLTFPRVIWRHSAKHPLGFRVVLVTTASIHLHYISLIQYSKKPVSVNTFLPLRHGTAASHTQPCRFAFLGQKARFLCKKAVLLGGFRV